MESTGRTGLILQSPTIDNIGGTILTDGSALQLDSGNVTIDAAVILGGTLSTVVYTDLSGAEHSSGTITFADGASVLDGRTAPVTLTNLTPLDVTSGSALTLLGSIAWQGATLAPTGSASNQGVVTGFGSVTGNLANAGTLVAQGGTFVVSGALTGAGSVSIDNGATFELGGASSEAVDFHAAAAATLRLDVPASYTGTLADLTNGDTIQLLGADVSAATVSGTTLAVTLTNSSVIDYQLANLAHGASFLIQSADTTQSTLVVQCFAQGTRILTDAGDVPVEELCLGDRVMTGMGGPPQSIRWIGRRHVNCRRHPDPQKVWPVRVSAHAFGPGQPARDLFLSPDHAIFVEGVLIPVKHLVNGTSLRQVPVESLTYFHIELEQHEVVLAEGLPCESYLDTGDRSGFSGSATTDLHPAWGAAARDITLIMDALSVAPLRVEGPEVDLARARIERINSQIPEITRSFRQLQTQPMT